MSAPTINTTTSVLGYKQWEAWEYQPYASNTPTSWACPNLPAGLSIDTSTGKISGAASVAGVFVCGLTATNGDGTSAPLVLTIGIEAANASLTNSGYEVKIDVQTREIVFLAASGGTSQTVEKTTVDASTTTKTTGTQTVGANAPKLFAKENDSLLLWISFQKGGVNLDLDIQSLALAIKEFEPDNRLVLGDTWKKFGSGSGAYYGLYAAASGSDLANALSNYEADSGTAFDGLAEIEWQEANADHAGGFGPENFRFTTRDFQVAIARDMVEEA
ncbi:MAG: Ig domain-containing protein [Verrucomicrobiota bacterium]